MNKKRYVIAGSVAIVLALGFQAQAGEAQEVDKIKLTIETAQAIAEGKIRLEDNRVDSLLYGEEVLKPDGDDDGDGLYNSEELYTYTKNGRVYYGYNSHPRLKDTDGDGISDREDKNPLQWDISSRDMAMFMELCYRDDDYISEVLDSQNPLEELYKGRQEYAMMHTELSRFWMVRETYHLSNGFDAVLFENRSYVPYLADKTVQVLAVRGTKGSADTDDDTAIFLGLNPKQAISIENLLKKYEAEHTVTNLYATGHSLGGYLAHRALINSKEENYTWFKQSYTFNAPKIKGGIFTQWLNRLAKVGEQLTLEGRSIHYMVNNDKLIPAVGNFAHAINIGNTTNCHGSRSYFESLLNGQPGFSIGDKWSMDGRGYAEENLSRLHFNQQLHDADVYDVEVNDEILNENGSIDLRDNIKNKGQLPQNIVLQDVTDYSKINLQVAGNYQGKLLVVFSDGSRKEVLISIVIQKKSNHLTSSSTIPEKEKRATEGDAISSATVE